MKAVREHWPQIAIALVVFGVLVGVSRLLGSIDIEHALHTVSHSLGAWTYALIGLAAFLETGAFVGLVLPGESVVILGGAVAGQGATSIVATVGVVWACAFAGDSASFVLGGRLGREFILKHGPKLRITEARFERVEAYFKRYGGRTILIGRFIGLVRALAPFTAGSSGMRYRNFLPYSLLGTGLWALTFSLIGYLASQHIDAAANAAGKSTFYFGVAVAVIAGAVATFRYLREAENREHVVARMEASSFLRPLLVVGRRVRPHAQFALDRVRPGDLGLELTALLAATAVGAYVVIAYAAALEPSSGPLRIDTWAFDAADRIQTGWLDDLAKALTALGSAAAMIVVGVVGAIALSIRRKWAAAVVLIAGLVAITFATESIKAAVDRPRPPDALVATSHSSFPSGHASHAVVYSYLAFVIAFGESLRARAWTVVVSVGIGLTVVVGLTRVYLRAHYASDVLGGWALGVAIFAGFAAVALVVTHLRKTGGEAEDGDPAGSDSD